jgi:hypothetical protein
MTERCVHYVGFRGDEYVRAKRLFGGPVIIHRWWDRRARREIDREHDLVVFATGDADQPTSPYNAPDIEEHAHE